MKKVFFLSIACLFALFCAAQTISDGSATWAIGSSNITGGGCSNFATFDSGNGIDQLYAVDWYIGIGTANSQNFPPADSFSATDNTIIATYSDLLGNTGLSAKLTIIITEFAPLDVQVAQIMQINNDTGSPIDIRLFNYIDLDKNERTTEDAILFLQDDCNLITQVNNVSDTTQICYYAVNAFDGYEILDFSSLCSKLNTGIRNLSNTGLPLLADDYTQALQFNATIPNGGISTGETLLTFGNPPEPATIDVNSGQCTFSSTPDPEFTIGQPVQNCNDDGSFTLVLAFSGDADGTEYTFTETNAAGINTVTVIDDGSISSITLGTYPIDASWNIEVMASFQQGVLNTFSGAGTCTVVIPGCTDNVACNYNPDATSDDGSCNQPDCEGKCDVNKTGPAVEGTACDDGDSTTQNDIYDMNCKCAGSAVAEGCTDNTACNYNPNVTIDDGSCNQPDCEGNCTGDQTGPAVEGAACDDGDFCTFNDVYQDNCICLGTPAFQEGCEGFELFIGDPCDCSTGIDLNGDGQVDLVQEEITVNGDAPPFTVIASSGNFYDAIANLYNLNDLTNLLNSSANNVALVYVFADGQATHSVTVADSAGNQAIVNGGPCPPCPSGDLSAIPTLSQWGVIILLLLFITTNGVFIIRRQHQLATAGLASSSMQLPLMNWALFNNMLLKALPFIVIAIALITVIEDVLYIRNIIGTFISSLIIVYLLHFVIMSDKSGNDGQS